MEHFDCIGTVSDNVYSLLSNLLNCNSVREIRLANNNYEVFPWITSLESLCPETIIVGYVGADNDAPSFVVPSTVTYLEIGSQASAGSHTEIYNFPSSVVSSNGTSLETLILKHSDLSSVDFLSDLTKLTTIDLSYNMITTLEGVTSSLTNVTSLTLSYNNLISLYGIQYFTALQTLSLSYNTTLGDTCSYDGTTYFNLKLLSDLCTNNQTLTKLILTGCTGITTDSTNSYWTTLKSLSGLTVTGP